MKDTFNEGMPYITHFTVHYQFLKRPQLLLAFIRYKTLTKSDLSEKI